MQRELLRHWLGQRPHVKRGAEPHICSAHARTERRASMIGAKHKVVFVRDIEVPQHAMQELRSVVRIDEIIVADL